MVMSLYLRCSPTVAMICMRTTWWWWSWCLHVVLILIDLILVMVLHLCSNSRSYRSINNRYNSTRSLTRLKGNTLSLSHMIWKAMLLLLL